MPVAGVSRPRNCPVRLTNETTHDLHPSWSADGSRLVFSRFGEMSNRWEMWVMGECGSWCDSHAAASALRGGFPRRGWVNDMLVYPGVRTVLA